MLTSAEKPAVPAHFLAAYLATTGDCDFGGAERICGVQLAIALAPVTGEASTYLGATRNPSKGWFSMLSTEPCAGVEALVRASTAWKSAATLAISEGAPVTEEKGRCVPGDDGTVWWVQPYLVEDLSVWIDVLSYQSL